MLQYTVVKRVYQKKLTVSMPFPRRGDISFEYTKRKIQFQSWINLVSQDKVNGC